MRTLLQIGSSLNYGSPGKIAEQIGIFAIRQGWLVYMAHGKKYSRPSQLKSIPVVNHFHEYIHSLVSLLFDAHGLSSCNKTRILVERIKEIKPDVIHLHNLHGYFLNYKILFDYLRTSEIPIVWTLHDFWPTTGHCAHFDYIGCSKWKTQCSNCPQTREYPKSFIDQSLRNYYLKRRLFTSVSNMTLVPVSNWIGDLVSQSFLGKYPIRVICNGIDTDEFRYISNNLRAKYNIENKKILLGVASPWYELKGMKDYFALNKKLPEEFQIIMIGLNKKQISQLPEGIIGLERVNSQNELAQYYSMSDIVLNLSYQETFGLTTVEGMACGTPGIAYNRTASPELITPETGAVVEAGNIDQLAETVRIMCINGKAFYSDACRFRAVSCFNKKDRCQDYMNLYNLLIEAEN